VCVTASIGIALSPRDGRDEETLKKNADAAMYQAKSQGKNNFQFYTDRLSSTSLERLSLEANLRHALERDELRLYYQARHDLTTGRVSGMEALLHWEHPDIGVIPPSRFLAVAEESGVIIPIGRWVLKTACEQSLALRRQGMPELCVTVSLSAAQFYDDRLLEDVRVVLAQTGLEPRLLELAIPETALTHRPEQTRERLQGLRKLGVRIAIGDFGFGYAWLEGLRDFSFDTIKIDRSLTRHVATSEQGAALAHAVIAVGRRLSGTVVAQGADTADEAQLLRTHGAGSLQGGCAGEPLPPEQFAASLRQEAATVLVPTSAHPGSKSRAG
jgi:EAL domain-containing protein (putative c-di-GMP-specific phosphodiesterase class I)